MMTDLHADLGDRAPPCFGMTLDHAFYSSEEQCGRPAAMLLIGAEASQAAEPLIQLLFAATDLFTARTADILLMVDDNPTNLWPDQPPPLRVIDCGTFLHRCGVGPSDIVLLLTDRNLRLAARLSPDHATDPVNACLERLDELPREEPRYASQPAPVVVLPNLLSRELCQSLIERFDTSPTIQGEIARTDPDGTVRSVVDQAKKDRRDMPIAPEDELHRTLQALLLSRCAPEIAKAFQVHVTHTDRILISRYDDSGGWFRRHRDNTADNIAFREFALSVNLNTEAFEGGHVLFPEYNDHFYRAPTGGGVIFSTAVQHEAAPVISGARYVLLTFLHSDAAEQRRLGYLAREEGANEAAPFRVEAA